MMIVRAHDSGIVSYYVVYKQQLGKRLKLLFEKQRSTYVSILH